MISCVYAITNTVNGKMYIGSTKNFENRKKQHLYYLRKGTHINIILQRSFNKHGESAFIFSILEEVEKPMLLDVEAVYIRKYNTKCNGYNIADANGGDCISQHPNKAEIRRKISESMKNRWNKLSECERIQYAKRYKGKLNPMYGKNHTLATKEKISSALTGHKMSDETVSNMKNAFTESRRKHLSDIASKRIGELNSFYGKSHTTTTKKILSEKAKDRGFMPNGNREFTINGIQYRSLNEAHKQTGIAKTVIRWRLNSNSDKFSTYSYLNESE